MLSRNTPVPTWLVQQLEAQGTGELRGNLCVLISSWAAHLGQRVRLLWCLGGRLVPRAAFRLLTLGHDDAVDVLACKSTELLLVYEEQDQGLTLLAVLAAGGVGKVPGCWRPHRQQAQHALW